MSSKKRQLSKSKPKKYRIYGIFNFETQKLLYVDLNKETVTFEFDLEGYDTDVCNVISFQISISQ